MPRSDPKAKPYVEYTATVFNCDLVQLKKYLLSYKLGDATVSVQGESNTATLNLVEYDNPDTVLENLRRALCMHQRVTQGERPARITHRPVIVETIDGNYI